MAIPFRNHDEGITSHRDSESLVFRSHLSTLTAWNTSSQRRTIEPKDRRLAFVPTPSEGRKTASVPSLSKDETSLLQADADCPSTETSLVVSDHSTTDFESCHQSPLQILKAPTGISECKTILQEIVDAMKERREWTFPCTNYVQRLEKLSERDFRDLEAIITSDELDNRYAFGNQNWSIMLTLLAKAIPQSLSTLKAALGSFNGCLPSFMRLSHQSSRLLVIGP